VHLPNIAHRRYLFRKIAMLHKPTCVGVAFHAMIFEKLYAFLYRFAELVLCARRHGDNGAFNSQAGNYKSHNAPVVEASSNGSFLFLPKRPPTTCFAVSLMIWPAPSSPLTIDTETSRLLQCQMRGQRDHFRISLDFDDNRPIACEGLLPGRGQGIGRRRL
jgi:hypothetical protein